MGLIVLKMRSLLLESDLTKILWEYQLFFFLLVSLSPLTHNPGSDSKWLSTQELIFKKICEY
jgi:hypothetical protein